MTMRRFVAVSVGMHLALTVVLSLPATAPPRPIFADPIYSVALVEWPEPNLNPPAPTRTEKKPKPPEPEPETPAPPPPPKPEDAVVVPKEKPKETPKPPEPPPKKPEPKPEPKPKPPDPKPVEKPVPQEQPEVKLPEDTKKPVSLGTVDQADFRHDYYLERVRAVLAGIWARQRPSGGTGEVVTSVHFVIRRDGSIVNPELVSPSGWSLFDRAALSTVQDREAKLPPLPQAYAGDELGITVNFKRVAGDR